MKITAIKPQVHRQDRYSIYGDGKYLLALSGGELLASGLAIGQEIDDERLAELQRTAVQDKAYASCLDLLARRPRSVWEMDQYLRRKDYDPPTIQLTLERLTQRSYLDDLKFAEAWVNTRRLLKNVSQRRLRQELQQKHIASDIISQVLTADETDERQVLAAVIDKKRQQSRYQDPQKLLAYLLRQGYNYDDIKFVLDDNSDAVA